MNGIFEKLYDMTAFSNIVAEPQFLVMYVIAFVLLYLGIKKQYEPLLLVPIAFGVLLANFPGGGMGVIQADENGMILVNGVMKNIWEMPLHDIAHELGLMNFVYYRWCGRTYGHLYHHQVGSASIGPDRDCRLFLYGIGSGYHSTGRSSFVYQEGAEYQYERAGEEVSIENGN